MDIKELDVIIEEKTEQIIKEKGLRYANAVNCASLISAIILGANEEDEETTKFFDDFLNKILIGVGEECSRDAMGIVDIMFEIDTDVSIYEAADKYFEGLK